MVGIAVNVIVVPVHATFEGLAVMLTPAVRLGFTVMETGVDEAGFPVTQVALLVITQMIWSPLTSALSEYVVLFVPTVLLFFFH